MRPMSSSAELRIGYGEDAHALAAGRPLRLGSVEIPDSPFGPVAVSDGDVLLHALADALLSAFALGDIGQLFPTGDPASRGLDSREIVTGVIEHIRREAGGLTVGNVAAVVLLDRPKLGPYRERIAASVAAMLGIGASEVGLTFKTSEGLAPGHVQARVSVLLRLGLRAR